MIVQGPLHGDARSSHSISVKDKMVAQKSMHSLVLPFHITQSYKLAISRMKRGGIEFIVAGCILQASTVWSIPQLLECWLWLPHALVPLHWTFYPCSNRDAPENVWKIAQSFLFTNLEESQLFVAGPVADTPHFVVLSQSHSYLEFVPLGWWWHTLPAQLTWPYKEECPLQEWWEKVVLVEDLWASVYWFFTGYEGTPSVTWHSTSYGSFSHWSFTFLFPL